MGGRIKSNVDHVAGQINIEEYLKGISGPKMGCSDCICKNCLYWWSSRCPYGACYDDQRAKENPYNAAHPNEPPRKLWSDWNKPGEQEHWCRGGTTYPTRFCEYFVKYTGSSVEECLKCNVQKFQDGYISCSMIEHQGCEACYKEFLERELK